MVYLLNRETQDEVAGLVSEVLVSDEALAAGVIDPCDEGASWTASPMASWEEEEEEDDDFVDDDDELEDDEDFDDDFFDDDDDEELDEDFDEEE